MNSKTNINRRAFLGLSTAGLILSPLANLKAAGSSLSCAVIPTETDGPYPAHSDDRGVNVLTEPGIMRSDITTSLATANYPGTKTAQGAPLSLRMRIVDATNGCLPLENYAVYIWHCDQTGLYSMYNQEIKSETYLRGVQVTDKNGVVEFQTIFPGCYDGRMVHIHFDVFKSIDVAINNKMITKTSQLTFPIAASKATYTEHAQLYTNGLQNLSRISFETDNVFSDGHQFQLATIESGNAQNGYSATLTVGVDPSHTEPIGRGPGGPGGPGGPPPRGGGFPPPGAF